MNDRERAEWNEIARELKAITESEEMQMKFLKALLDKISRLMTGRYPDMVDAGVCDYSGQGRDKYGR